MYSPANKSRCIRYLYKVNAPSHHCQERGMGSRHKETKLKPESIHGRVLYNDDRIVVYNKPNRKSVHGGMWFGDRRYMSVVCLQGFRFLLVCFLFISNYSIWWHVRVSTRLYHDKLAEKLMTFYNGSLTHHSTLNCKIAQITHTW